MFVYRGKDYERYEDFRLRLATQFPNADKMSSTAPPSDSITNSPLQHVQCFTVKPVLNLPLQFKDKPVPEQILNFYRANEVQQFQYSRPFHRGEKDPDNEFLTMWIERVTYTTVYKFPGILQWFEVNTVTVEEISPLENAIETMERTNEKISNMVQRYAWEVALPAHPLSMLLSGIVDAAVMGGSANYEKAFFSTKYIQQHPEDQHNIDTLKELIALQIPLLAEGIRIHGEKATVELRPLHDWIVSCFRELKEKVQKLYGVITLPPALTDRKRSRSGSVILPYIMSSTLRRLSTVSLMSTSSTSSDSNPSRPHSNGSVLDPLVERRPLALCRPEEQLDREELDRRGSTAKLKDKNLSKSQVIFESEARSELSLSKVDFTEMEPPLRLQRPKSLQFVDKRLPSLQISSPLPQCPTPPSSRSPSQLLLQTDSMMSTSPGDTSTPPPTPPKSKPCENGSQRHSLQLVPPLPEKTSPRPPHPPPKARHSNPTSPQRHCPAEE
ncbi:dedicator of cytokinesis protein 5-like [Amblyraja radiata]|uniref:dedicator of cytokinesis protein 5-like n=1 Tax=Amblyraja radiata TaxID=386614 RepID=UPI0014030E65|nr:dedicator of cytokinesis protein 5-like [Amblyraja radiata]